MTENEQIEELAGDAQIGALAKELHGYCQAPCPNGGCHTCAEYRIARNIYSKGFRKVERGEWIGTREAFAPHPYVYNCSVCGFKISHCAKMAYKFCANCGADMRKEGAE